MTNVILNPALIGADIGASLVVIAKKADEAKASFAGEVMALIAPYYGESLATRTAVADAIDIGKLSAATTAGQYRSQVKAILKHANPATLPATLRAAYDAARAKPEDAPTGDDGAKHPTAAQITAYLKRLDDAGWQVVAAALIARASK